MKPPPFPLGLSAGSSAPGPRVAMSAAWPLVLLLAAGQSLAAPQAITRSELRQALSELRARRLLLAPSATRALTGYVRTEDGDALYVKSRSLLFRHPYPIEVSVEKLGGVQRTAYLRLAANGTPGTARIDIYPPHGKPLTSDGLSAVLREIFLSDSAAALAPLIGNRRSRMAHVREANHLPDPEDRLQLESPAAAGNAGYRLCPICFRLLPPVSGYALEARLGANAAAQYRAYHPVIYEDSLSPRLESIGRKVLANWVIPLRGYTYRFYVSDDEDLNAFACPGGQIFVTKGLLNALESDEELEAILAHEIAHIERRHGYLQYRTDERNLWAAILIGSAVGIATESVNAGAVTASVVRTSGAIAMAGYGRAHEEEADAYSLTYLALRSGAGSPAPLLTALKKIQYDQTAGGVARGSALLLSTHPGIFERIDRIERALVDTFSAVARFTGYDKEDRPLLTATLETQMFSRFAKEREDQFVSLEGKKSWSISSRSTERFRSRRLSEKSELQLFATLESTINLSNTISIGDMFLGGQSFTNTGTTEIGPLESVGANFRIANADGLVSILAGDFQLSVPGVARWERTEEEPFEEPPPEGRPLRPGQRR